MLPQWQILQWLHKVLTGVGKINEVKVWREVVTMVEPVGMIQVAFVEERVPPAKK